MSEQCDIAVDLGVLPRAALTLAPGLIYPCPAGAAVGTD